MKFIFRGDLGTHNGYARATRAYAALCSNFGEITGIRMYGEPDPSDRWKYPVIKEEDIFFDQKQYAGDVDTIVIQVCTPDLYIRFPNVKNVGCFFWETSVLPLTEDWVFGLGSVDDLWLPATYMLDMCLTKSFKNKEVIPWPILFSTETLDDINLPQQQPVNDKLIGLSATTSSFGTYTISEIKKRYKTIFLTISSIAARKGIPSLISSWHSANTSGALIIKLSLKHLHFTGSSLIDYLNWSNIKHASLKNVFFIIDDVSEESIANLYRHSDFYITNTYGEGYGGPIAEAIVNNIPVISPIHTGIVDLLPPDHALRVSHEALQINLPGNLAVYSSASIWNIPNKNDLVEKIKQSYEINEEQRLVITQHQLAFFAANNNKSNLLSKMKNWINQI